MTQFCKSAMVTAAAFIVGTSSGAETLDLGEKSKVGSVQGLTLQAKQAAHYRKFKHQDNYFGVFFVNKEEDKSFFVTGFHDLANAKKSANRGCQEVSIKKEACVLYAMNVPASVSFEQTRAIGLGKKTREVFRGDYQEKQAADKYGAFAISGAYHYGFSFQWDSEAEARDTAISYCQKAVADSMADLNMSGRAWVRKQGIDRCRVVDVVRPGN